MAEVNIIIIGNYSSINLYAQLVLVAELRPKQCCLRLSADAASCTIGTIRDYNLHQFAKYNQFFHPGAKYSHEWIRLCLTLRRR